MPEGFSVDSYRLPVQKSQTEIASGFANLANQAQQYQQGAVNLDASKLKLVNDQFQLMNNELAGLANDPSVTKEQAAQRLGSFAQTYKFPPEVTKHMMDELNSAPNVQSFAKNAIVRGMQTMEKVQQLYGGNQDLQDNSNQYSGVRQSPMQGGQFAPKTVTPIQLPVGTPSIDVNPTTPTGQPNPNFKRTTLVGADAPPGPRPALPVGPANGPITSPAIKGPSSNFGGTVLGANVENSTFNNRFNAARPSGVVAALAPGEAGATAAVSEQSGEDYATDLSRAKNFKADLYPAEAALQGVKELGVQGVGPGTEPLNNIKSALITWLPNADKDMINNVGTFEQTRKYLTQIARSSGTTGTNDQLAAAFEANPSIKMSQAATENVLKSVIALRKMQHAQTLLFGESGLQPEQYSKWISTNQNVLDPRAFGFDMMDNEAKSKLVGQLKKDPKAYKKFEDSLTFAHDAGLIEPPARK